MSDLGYPMIQARNTNYSQGRQGYSILWLVVHCTAQPYQDNYPQLLGQYWARKTTKVSVHYGVSDTQVRQYVAHADNAWQAGSTQGNLRGLGIEFAGLESYNRATWLSHDQMLRNGGTLLAQMAAKHGIPLKYATDDDLRARRPGIVTHKQLSRVFGGSHQDPGPGFPLDVLLNYAQGTNHNPEEDEEMAKTFLQGPITKTLTDVNTPDIQSGALGWGPGWVRASCEGGTGKIRIALFRPSGNGDEATADVHFRDVSSKKIFTSIPMPPKTYAVSFLLMESSADNPEHAVSFSYGIEIG